MTVIGAAATKSPTNAALRLMDSPPFLLLFLPLGLYNPPRRGAMGHDWATRMLERRVMSWRSYPWLAVVVATSCGGPDPNSPSRPLPTYEGHQTELFDDAIDPRAVGLNLDDATRTPLTDAVLRERTQVGDAVVRARVETVTAKHDMGGDDVEYQLGLQVMEKLTGEHPPADEFVVRLDKASPSAGIVRSMDARLGGKSFVVFLRAFKGMDNEPRIYAHFAPDSKDVVAAVKDAMALSEFK
jgi:hypothetical protein